MKLLDTSAINYVLKNDLHLEEDYFITSDIEEEKATAEISLGKVLSGNIKNILENVRFPKHLYIKNYFHALNKNKDIKRSFFNMTGFGDVSLMALIQTLQTLSSGEAQQLPIPGISQKIIVYVDDSSLIKAIEKLNYRDVIIKHPSEL